MIRRLRHRLFGHGLGGHKFMGYYLNCIYVRCRCRELLEFRLSNFFGFTINENAAGVRVADELNRHGTT